MKAVALVPALATAALATGCGGDNCARQVTGTRPGLTPLSSRRSDCSSIMRTTVIPDVTTTTVTVTATNRARSRVRRRGGLEGRALTEFPTAVPTYAPDCRGLDSYSTACSCWGITAVTTTAPTPTQTKTVTVTRDACDDL